MAILNREFRESDKAFIISTWAKGQLYGEPYFAGIPASVYFDKFPKYIKAVLASPAAKVNIACLSEDEDVILGYCVITHGKALIWAFVKSPWRGQGIARSLIPGTVACVGSRTKAGAAIAAKKGWAFDPWAAL